MDSLPGGYVLPRHLIPPQVWKEFAVWSWDAAVVLLGFGRLGVWIAKGISDPCRTFIQDNGRLAAPILLIVAAPSAAEEHVVLADGRWPGFAPLHLDLPF